MLKYLTEIRHILLRLADFVVIRTLQCWNLRRINLLVVFKSDNKEVRTGFKAIYDMRKGKINFCFLKTFI